MAAASDPQIPPEEIERIEGFATPPTPPLQPFHALASVFRLIRNKEDTRQVFEVVRALAGRSPKRLFRRFVGTPYGRRVVSEPVRIEAVLSDRERLRALPEGSLGRAYLAFMEGENLTADGLLQSAAEAGIEFRDDSPFPAFERLFLHLDISHDVWHVLTGYGRDALGELCNLAFTRAQTKNPGFRLMIWVGLAAMKLERPFAPLWRAANEGRRMGRKARWVVGEDIEALLPRPLDEVRRGLNILTPVAYRAVPDEVKRALLKPKATRTQAEREGQAQPA
ncbi:MAG: Coq4 family protein [Amphiplicatus sp.]